MASAGRGGGGRGEPQRRGPIGFNANRPRPPGNPESRLFPCLTFYATCGPSMSFQFVYPAPSRPEQIVVVLGKGITHCAYTRRLFHSQALCRQPRDQRVRGKCREALLAIPGAQAVRLHVAYSRASEGATQVRQSGAVCQPRRLEYNDILTAEANRRDA